MSTTESKVLEVLSKVSGIGLNTSMLEMSLEGALEIDSLKMSELVIALEDEFRIMILDTEVDQNFKTVGSVLSYIQTKVTVASTTIPDPGKPILVVGEMSGVTVGTISRADVWKCTEILAHKDGKVYQLHVTVPQLDKQEWRPLEALDDIIKRYPNSAVKE